MRSLIILVLSAAACGGSSSSLTPPSTDGGGADAVAESGPAEAAADALADVSAQDSSTASADAGLDAAADTGAVVEAGLPPALCCTNASGNAGIDIHCGPTAWAPCTYDGGTYNAADCTGGLGASCTAWPNEYDYCLPNNCCIGTVAVCGAGM